MRCGTGTSLACREVPTIQVRDRNSRRCKGQLPALLRKIFLIIIIDNVKFTDLTYLSNLFLNNGMIFAYLHFKTEPLPVLMAN